MANGKIVVEIDGDELKAVKAFAALSEEQKNLVGDLGKVGAAAEEAADRGIKAAKREVAERRRQVSMAKRLVKSNETLKESYKSEVATLKSARKQGEISNEEFAKTIKRIETKYKAEGAAAKEAQEKGSAAFQEKQRRAAAGEKTVKRLIKANETLDKQYDHLRREIKAAFDSGVIEAGQYKRALSQLQKEQDDLARTQNKTFGKKGVAAVGDYIASIALVGVAIAGVKKAFAELQEEVERGRAATERLKDPRVSLLQVSDETNFQQRKTRSDDAAIKFGVGRDKSMLALFDSISNDVEKDYERVLRADRVIPSEIGAKFVGEFRKQFFSENLTADQSLNTALAGAKNSKFNVQELQPQVRTAAQGAATLPGSTSAEVTALVAGLAVLMGQQTGTNVRSLQANFGAQRVMVQNEISSGASGSRLVTLERQLEVLSDGPIEIIENLGKKENAGLRAEIIKENRTLLTSYRTALAAIPQIKAIASSIEFEQSNSGRDSLLNKRLRAFMSDPIALANINATRASIKREVDAENAYSEFGSSQSSVRDFVNADITNDISTGRVNAFVGGFAKFYANRELDLRYAVGADPKGLLKNGLQGQRYEQFLEDTFDADTKPLPADNFRPPAPAALDSASLESILLEQNGHLKQLVENTVPKQDTRPLSLPGVDQ